jgi:hypothetical protein
MSKRRHKREEQNQHHFNHHTLSSSTTQQINDRLTAIYKDENGDMPDMKHIAIKKRNPFLRFVFFALIIGALICVGAWIKVFIFPTLSSQLTDNNQIEITLSGPTDLSLGATSTYTVSYKNHLSVPLVNSVISLRYPNGFIFVTSSRPTTNTSHNEVTLATIPAQAEGSFTITGRMYGSLQQPKSWSALLHFQPENVTSVQQKIATLETKIISSPYSLSITGPEKITIGTDTDFIFTVKKELGGFTEPLEITPVVPENFSISSSTPLLNSNTHWTVSASTSTALSFKLHGKFTSSSTSSPMSVQAFYLPPGATQNFLVAETQFDTQLASTNVALTVSTNGSSDTSLTSAPGEHIAVAVNLKNITQQTLKDITAQLVFQGPSADKKSILDWNNLQDTHNGKVVGEQISDTVRQGTITWNKTQIPGLAQLKPNEEITIEIQLPIKSSKDFDLSSVPNKVITIIPGVTVIDSKNKSLTTSASSITIALGASISFENRHTVTTDTNGKEVHSLNWVLNNTSSGLKNIQISADIFGDVTFTESSPPSAGTESFDQTKKHLVWTMASLPSEADVVNFPFTITLNSKNPTQTSLMSKVTVVAEDAETGNKITASADAIPLSAN